MAGSASFLRIPLEIRQAVYRCFFFVDLPVVERQLPMLEGCNKDVPMTTVDLRTTKPATAALFSTNRQIQQELKAMLAAYDVLACTAVLEIRVRQETRPQVHTALNSA